MTGVEQDGFRQTLTAELVQDVPEIVRDWVRLVRGRSRARDLSEEELRGGITAILHGLAQLVSAPSDGLRPEVLGELRGPTHLRRERGYELVEILGEFDLLGEVLTERALKRMSAKDDLAPDEAGGTIGLLASGLRDVSHAIVSAFRAREAQLASGLSERMEEFASTLVHELAQPLNTIQLACSLIESESGGADLAEYTGIMRRALGTAKNLIDDVRIINLFESARRQPRWGAPRVIIEQVFEQLENRAGERDVELRVKGEMPPVEVDSLRLHLALLHIVGNGIKYANSERDSRWVEVGAEWNGRDASVRGCTLLVRDNGIGIPAQARERVFQQDFRASPEHAEGMGLGLYLAQACLEAVGGRVWIESSSGEGSCFAIRLEGRAAEPSGS